jgi:hypothetical protein
VGLDIYAGPVTRYATGDWLTIVQQAGAATGTIVRVLRPDEPAAPRHPDETAAAVTVWRHNLLAALDATDNDWDDNPDAPYETDKPDWDGYGAVILLAAYNERPDLAPGATIAGDADRRVIAPTLPRDYQQAPAYQAASQAPQRYPTLLHGAEWCLPISTGPAVFEAPTPAGARIRMGHVEQLLAELHNLNRQTVQLSPAALATARRHPPARGAPVADVAPFGLATLTALAEFAAVNHTCWIMDY